MGVRMSGLPSCARIEPSTYSTIECTMLCGCTTTCTADGSIPNSTQASISSRPLFIRVAESTEILRPMRQRGCAQACSGVTSAICSRVARRNGPPDAVSRIRRTPAGAAPVRSVCGMHWKIALCSLSIGTSIAPPWRAASTSSDPAITSDSLFATSTCLPARAAASVEGSPAAPTIAAITTSTSALAAQASSAAGPQCTSVGQPAARNSVLECPGGRGLLQHRDRRPEAQALREQRASHSRRPRAPSRGTGPGAGPARRAC